MQPDPVPVFWFTLSHTYSPLFFCLPCWDVYFELSRHSNNITQRGEQKRKRHVYVFRMILFPMPQSWLRVSFWTYAHEFFSPKDLSSPDFLKISFPSPPLLLKKEVRGGNIGIINVFIRNLLKERNFRSIAGIRKLSDCPDGPHFPLLSGSYTAMEQW